MRNRKQTLVLSVLALLVVAWMTIDFFIQSGNTDFKGGFTEISSYRNENNTGPIQLIYAVKVKDTTGAELEAYGNSKPHHKYGTTKVYFFLANSKVPTVLVPGAVNFDPSYNNGCFAVYEKGAMGNFGLTKKR
jgi:hypothetical protein